MILKGRKRKNFEFSYIKFVRLWIKLTICLIFLFSSKQNKIDTSPKPVSNKLSKSKNFHSLKFELKKFRISLSSVTHERFGYVKKKVTRLNGDTAMMPFQSNLLTGKMKSWIRIWWGKKKSGTNSNNTHVPHTDKW